MKRAAFLLALSLAALSAQAEQWLLVAKSQAIEYHGQVGSAMITDKTVSFVVRARPVAGGGSIDLYRAIVSREDCTRQSGQIIYTDLALKEVRMRVDFAFGAGNIASGIAERVCNELRGEQPAKSQGVQL